MHIDMFRTFISTSW